MITLPSSEYFSLRSLGSGVFAAIAKDDSPAYSNAGVVDTGDHILIFDTFNTFRAAVDLRRDVEIVTRRLANYVIISHSHTDHWMGNQAFEDHATILASRQTTDSMVDWASNFGSLKRNPQHYKDEIGDLEQRLAKADDPRLRAHLSWSLIIKQHEYKNINETELFMPNQSFDSKLDIYGTDALVKIMTLGEGHSDSDTIMVLPEDRIAFIGDIGFFKTHPYLSSSNPEKWMAILDELAGSKINVFIPGHGPVGTKADILALKAYILTLQALVAAVVNCGGSEDDAASQPVPDFAADWAGFDRFENSMRFLYKRQIHQESSGGSILDGSRSLTRDAKSAGYVLNGIEISILEANQSQNQTDKI